jgi:hypothetical protein
MFSTANGFLLGVFVLLMISFMAFTGCGDDDDDDDDSTFDDDDDSVDDDDSTDDDDFTADDDDDDDNDDDTVSLGKYEGLVVSSSFSRLLAFFSEEDSQTLDPADLAIQHGGLTQELIRGGSVGIAGAAIAWTDTPSHLPELGVFEPFTDQCHDLTTDLNGALHLVFVDNERNLSYGTNKSGVWEIESIAAMSNGTDCREPIDIQLDGSGNVHVVFSQYDSFASHYRIAYASNAAKSWTLQTVEYRSSRSPTFAVDNAGVAHLAYVRAGANPEFTPNVIYAENSGGTWNKTVLQRGYFEVYEGGVAGTVPAIGIDPTGAPHIVFRLVWSAGHWATSKLVHLEKTSSGWNRTTSDAGVGGTKAELFIGANGEMDLFSSSADFWHTQLRNGVWSAEKISETEANQFSIVRSPSGFFYIVYLAKDELVLLDNSDGVGWVERVLAESDSNLDSSHPSLTLDSNDSVYMSFLNDGMGPLMYGTNQSGNWSFESIFSDVYPSHSSTNILIDQSGIAHVPFVGGVDGRYDNYATNASGSWYTTQVRVGTYDTVRNLTAIAKDESGNLHITYNTADPSTHDYQIVYATNSSGTWQWETVPTSDEAWHHDLVVDSSGNVFISYYDPLYEALKMAEKTAQGWSFFTLDFGTSTGEYNSMAIDDNDQLHIVYYDREYDALRYIVGEPGDWSRETVNPMQSSGLKSSIVLDENGFAHVCYTGDGLYYATNMSGVWETALIDHYGESSYWIFQLTVAIDSTGKVHVGSRAAEAIWHTTFPMGFAGID